MTLEGLSIGRQQSRDIAESVARKIVNKAWQSMRQIGDDNLVENMLSSSQMLSAIEWAFRNERFPQSQKTNEENTLTAINAFGAILMREFTNTILGPKGWNNIAKNCLLEWRDEPLGSADISKIKTTFDIAVNVMGISVFQRDGLETEEDSHEEVERLLNAGAHRDQITVTINYHHPKLEHRIIRTREVKGDMWRRPDLYQIEIRKGMRDLADNMEKNEWTPTSCADRP